METNRHTRTQYFRHKRRDRCRCPCAGWTSENRLKETTGENKIWAMRRHAQRKSKSSNAQKSNILQSMTCTRQPSPKINRQSNGQQYLVLGHGFGTKHLCAHYKTSTSKYVYVACIHTCGRSRALKDTKRRQSQQATHDRVIDLQGNRHPVRGARVLR